MCKHFWILEMNEKLTRYLFLETYEVTKVIQNYK